jgi:signal transduction histidine kinase
VAQFPSSEQALLTARNTKSILAVPIFVGQQWWGGIGFEDCFQEREWSSMEVDALLTAASILGLTMMHHKEERALRESEEKLRSLSYQLLTAQEQERRRLASELHNVLGHDLLLLKLKLESLREEVGPEQSSPAQEVRQLIRALQDSVRNVRRLCQDLTPGELEDLGLTMALQILVENFSVAQRLTWQTELDELDDLFEIPVQTAIYRMVQEALTNIGKHAQAQHLWLRVQRTGSEVAFVIEDDGKGFNVAKTLASKRTLGLLAMEERIKIMGGAFEIVSRKREGTRITFTIPVGKHGDQQ